MIAVQKQLVLRSFLQSVHRNFALIHVIDIGVENITDAKYFLCGMANAVVMQYVYQKPIVRLLIVPTLVNSIHTCNSDEKCITADLEFGQCCPDAKCIPDQDCSQVDCAPPNACENHSCNEGYKCESELIQGSCCETEALCVRDLDCASLICPNVMMPPPGTCQEGERLCYGRRSLLSYI